RAKLSSFLRYEGVCHRTVAVRSELRDQCSRACSLREPCRARRTEHRRVEFPVAVIITRRGNVTICPEREREVSEVFRSRYEPLACRRTPERDVRLAVSGEVTLNRF